MAEQLFRHLPMIRLGHRRKNSSMNMLKYKELLLKELSIVGNSNEDMRIP
nr:MAG TPA: hypothetical protein [Caudoviricetes sp.]